MRLTLPVPPSVNGLYRNVPGRGRVPTGLYQRWRKEATVSFLAQKRHPIVGPVTIIITLPDKGRFDCDNKIKAVQDFLVSAEIISDDDRTIVRSVTAKVGNIDHCLVEVEPC